MTTTRSPMRAHPPLEGIEWTPLYTPPRAQDMAVRACFSGRMELRGREESLRTFCEFYCVEHCIVARLMTLDSSFWKDAGEEHWTVVVRLARPTTTPLISARHGRPCSAWWWLGAARFGPRPLSEQLVMH